jgi:hypothetical protein
MKAVHINRPTAFLILIIVLVIGWPLRRFFYGAPLLSFLVSVSSILLLVLARVYLKRRSPTGGTVILSSKLKKWLWLLVPVGATLIACSFIWAILGTRFAPDTSAGVWLVFGPGLTLLFLGIIFIGCRIMIWLLDYMNM